MVGQGRLELPTPGLSGTYSNQLSYWPTKSLLTYKSSQQLVSIMKIYNNVNKSYKKLLLPC